MKFWHTLQKLQVNSHTSWLAMLVLSGIVFSLSLGQLGRLGLGTAVFYPHDVLICIWILIESKVVASLLQSAKARPFKEHVSEYLFIGWVLIGMLLAYFRTGDVLPWLYLLRLALYSLFLVTIFTKFKKCSITLLTTGITIGVAMVLTGFFQYLFIPDTRFLFMLGWDEHYYRLIGTLLDPNYTGLVLIITAWAIFSLRKRITTALVATSIGVLLIGIGLTFSRASYLALVVSILCYFLLSWWQSKKFSLMSLLSLAAVICVIVFAVLLAPKPGGEGVDLLRTTSITARFKTSSEFLTIMQPWQWVTGAGFYTRPIEIHDLTSHAKVPDNLLVLLVYSTGIIGTALAIWSGIKLSNYVTTQNSILLPIASAVLTHSQFNNSVLEPFVFLIGGIVVVGLLAEKNQKLSV